jgi:hypothetical protein
MKLKCLLATLITGAVCHFATAQDIDNMAPVVVKTVPEAGTKDVAPGVVEIKVTFSKDMRTRKGWRNRTTTAITALAFTR